MICPRCGRDSASRGAFCAGCGAPLVLQEERPPRPLDRSVSLDRRADRARPPPPAAPPPPLPAAPAAGRTRRPEPGPAAAAVLAELGAAASGWQLGASAGASCAEPVPGPLSPVDTGSFAWGTPAPAFAPGREPGGDGEPAIAPEDGGPAIAPPREREIHLRRPATWRRAGAWAIDVLPLSAAAVAVGHALVTEARAGLPPAPAGLGGFLDLVAQESLIAGSLAALLVVVLYVYTTLAHGLAGATLGKWILGLRVVGPEGARPSLPRSAVRSTLALLSAALLGAGFLLALFTASGRSLHDLLARTCVVEAP